MSGLAKAIKGDLTDMFNTRPRSTISKVGIALGAFNIVAGAVLMNPVIVATGVSVVVGSLTGDRMNRASRPSAPSSTS